MKKKVEKSHVALGVVLVFTAILILTSVLTTFSLGQDENVNLISNVNIGNGPPTFSGHAAWQHPEGGSESSFTFTGEGDTITGVVWGYTTIIVNVNVKDPNGYSIDTINVSARLRRTINDGTNVNLVGEDVFDWDGSYDLYHVPNDGVIACSDLGVTADPKEHTWNCSVNIHYNGSPTAPGTDNASEHWRMVMRASDGTELTRDYDTIHFEYPDIVGISISDPLINFPATTPDGTVVDATISAANTPINRGNVKVDMYTETDQVTDDAAWTCVPAGAAEPLVNDIHLQWSDTYNGDYNYSPPLNFSGEAYFHDINLPVMSNHTYNATSVVVRPMFATTQPVKPGICTLSDVIMTAVKSTS